MWGRGSGGNSATCSTLPIFSHFPCYPQSYWALLVLIPRWVCLCTFQDPVDLSNQLSCEAGSFSYCCLNPHRCFQSEILKLYFPVLDPWVAWCVLLRGSSPIYLHQNVGPPSPQPQPCCQSSPPGCLSLPLLLTLPLLLVWMNVSSLTPWLLDFHTVLFSVSSGFCF